jgi:uncharacterized repeat protein (TIGR01451 family)
MSKLRSIHARLFLFLIIQALAVLAAVVIVSAAQVSPAGDLSSVASVPRLEPSRSWTSGAGTLVAAPQQDTTLQVSIVSSPWALLDSNKWETEGPHVLVVEAEVTNTGPDTAEDVVVSLNYNEDPANNWVLLAGEDPERNLRELAVGQTYHVYWFTTYPRTDPSTHLTHQYVVTARATNAPPVSTSTDIFRPTSPTVETRRALSGGSTRLLQSTSAIIVGRVFTATVEWSLGTNFSEVLLSPVGNVDFDPSSYRLVASTVTFRAGTTPISTVHDRLYFDTVPVGTTHARGEFIFLALRARGTQICPYTAPLYASDFKYDNAFCTPALPIEGSVSLSLVKQANAAYVQQGRPLTYTISYANNGTLPLGNVWIWDDIDPAIGSVITSSIDPASDPGETISHTVAWFVNEIPATGQPGSAGTLTFAILVDGGGEDILDQTPVVNHAFFGVDPATLPANAALTTTITSTVQAPTIVVAKTDGLEEVNSGEGLVYTLRITNSGSVAANGVVIEDRLPDGVSNPDGQLHTWTVDSIPPNGGNEVLTLPATVAPVLPDGTVLTNVMTATYQNLAGWDFRPITATDTTTVRAPFWVLIKSDTPDPVVAGTPLTYTLSYYQNGLTPATGITLVDTLPGGVTYDRLISQPAGWTGPAYNPGPPATLTWSAPTLTAGASGDILFSVTVNPNATGPISNEARVTSTEPATSTVTSQGTTVEAETDLAVTKSGTPDPVIAGTLLTYSIVASNLGPSDATGVTVTDTLPTGVTFQSASPTPGSFNQATGVWSIGTLASGASATLTLVVTVDPDTTGTLRNTATITGAETDPVATNNTASADTTVEAEADLAIDKTVSPSQVPAGAVLTYTLAYANGGPSDAQGVSIVDTLSTKVVYVDVLSTDPPLPNPTVNGSQITWSIATLAADASGTIVFRASVRADAIGAIPNGVTVSSSTTDPNPGNNEAVAEAFVGAADQATIFGFVFEDVNGNGVQDSGEPGIQGVTITLNGTESTTTDAEGLYYFIVSEPGVYTVVETDPTGYFSTTPNQVRMEVSLGSSYPAHFGDARESSPFANIYGTVFEDTNGNGLWDGDELGLDGVALRLDGTTSTTTDSYGNYSFRTDIADVHVVRETDPTGYFSTTPNEVHVDVQLGTSYRVDFGDASETSPFASIYGTVFDDDKDTNGLWDLTELGLPGVTIKLNGGATATTDQYGSYSLSTTLVGTNIVVETDPAGYVSTTPNEVDVDVLLGHGYLVDFGDVQAALCTCTADVYEEDDDMDQAKALNIRQAHDFCDDATDWTQFTAQAGNIYTFTTSAGGPDWYWGRRADTYLALFDSHANLLMANDDYEGTQDYSSRIVWRAPASGVYYLRTTNKAGLTGCLTDYEVWIERLERTVIYLPLIARNYSGPSVTPQEQAPDMTESDQGAAAPAQEPEEILSPTGEIYHVCPDTYETDDTWQQAKPIVSGVVQVHSFDSDPGLYAADKDFVYLNIQAGRTVTFTVPVVTNALTLLEMYDQEGKALPGVTGDDELIWTPTVAGHYYLGVSPQLDTFGCTSEAGYELLMEMKPMTYTYLPMVVRSYSAP